MDKLTWWIETFLIDVLLYLNAVWPEHSSFADTMAPHRTRRSDKAHTFLVVNIIRRKQIMRKL